MERIDIAKEGRRMQWEFEEARKRRTQHIASVETFEEWDARQNHQNNTATPKSPSTQRERTQEELEDLKRLNEDKAKMAADREVAEFKAELEHAKRVAAREAEGDKLSSLMGTKPTKVEPAKYWPEHR